ncbi:esterase FE4-like, partial [Trichogramma pretiosum]|uniref:esterase FE4-like n=1 Tax=Trichogramma pretiosum TaxID=7493 RepID=UPI0006C96E57
MNGPQVTVEEGILQGSVIQGYLGNSYIGFKGIPYAEPPLGSLRFKEPKPARKWSGVRDATEYAGDIAMQLKTYGPPPYEVLGSEDCLYLNVFSQKLEKNRPVMFFIHGGGFVEGSARGNIYREDYMMTQDIVYVGVNYRLGPFGFLNLGHEVAPGNQGIRDILLALKWVQKNIRSFGGDPNNVTIFGNSSGSMTTHFLTLIPASKGLFHKAILQSGSSFGMSNLVNPKRTDFKNGFKIASNLGCDSEDPVEVLEFLRTVPGDKLIDMEGNILTRWERVICGKFEYGPVYDAYFTNDPILPVPLKYLLNNDANIPMIIGHTSDESLLFFTDQFDDVSLLSMYDKYIEDCVKNHLLLKDQTRFDDIMEDIRRFYLKHQPINKENWWNLIGLMSDMLMINPNRKIIDLRNKHCTRNAPTYVFNFSYLGNQSTFYQFDHGPQPLKGVAHADELSYMFYLTYMKENIEGDVYPEKETSDRKTIERLVRMWYNFAAFGNPTEKLDNYITTEWKPIDQNNLYYLDIGENLNLKDDKNSENRKLYE